VEEAEGDIMQCRDTLCPNNSCIWLHLLNGMHKALLTKINIIQVISPKFNEQCITYTDTTTY